MVFIFGKVILKNLKKIFPNKFQCFTLHFFISLNYKHQHNALRTHQ